MRTNFIRSVEHVSVYVTTKGHGHRGDLEFKLTSPAGTPSALTWKTSETGEDYEKFKFTTVRNWGEVASGVWKLSVVDAKENDNAGRLWSWVLVIYGTCAQDAETCHYTTTEMDNQTVWETKASKMVAMKIVRPDESDASSAPDHSAATALLVLGSLVWSRIR